MNTTARHDPLLKSHLRGLLEAFLYAPVWEDHEKRLRSIILQNARANNSSFHVFAYRGKTYVTGNPSKMPRPMVRLHASLKHEMDAYIRDVKEVQDCEKPFVIGYITQVLNLSPTREDHLLLLPESVHKPILDMKAYSPYGAKQLAPHVIHEFLSQNQKSLALLKRRQMLNLLMR